MPHSNSVFVLDRDRPLDGALGTELQRRFAAPPEAVGRWHETHPEDVAEVHLSYLGAGAQAVATGTLTVGREPAADALRLAEAAVRLARAAAGEHAVVLLSLAPSADAADLLPALAESAASAGASAILLETATSLADLAAAVEGLRRAGETLPIAATVVCDDVGERTLCGDAAAAECARVLADAGADAVGVNCVPPDAAAAFARAMAAALPPDFPLILRASAGIPEADGVSWSYPWRPVRWAETVGAAAADLPNLRVGGCCGAGPRHISALAGVLTDRP